MDLNLIESLEQNELPLDSNHLSWIYENEADQIAVVKPYMLAHLAQRHQCLLVVPKKVASAVRDACRQDDIQIDRYEDSGQLIVVDPEDLFFADGPFDIDVILHRMQSAWTQAIAAGWERLAVAGDPSGLLDRAKERDWLDLEFRIDYECLTQPCSVLCIYDARQASGTFITQIIKAHPVVGLGRGLARNPFYGGQTKETI